MDPAPPPPKKSGPGRWILLGCGILTGLLVLGMAGCGGIFYFIYQGTMPIANEGLQFLDTQTMQKAFGPRHSVHRNAMGWNVQTSGNSGSARIEYTVRDDAQKDAGAATVWLEKSGGKWTGVGARVVPKKGEMFTIGTPPKHLHRIDWDD